MRDKVSVFYYPDMDASNSTIKKAILFFDEIHFVDRPSLSFGKQGTWGSFTTVGCPSSFRELQPALKEEDRKSTRLNSSHQIISYAVFCLKKKIVQVIAG